MRWLRSGRVVASLVVILSAACSGTDVTINSTADGTSAIVSGDGAAPPVLVDKDGIHEPPTPTPDRITPRYPITPPAPTATPKP
jgi:hypothetical protein